MCKFRSLAMDEPHDAVRASVALGKMLLEQNAGGIKPGDDKQGTFRRPWQKLDMQQSLS